MEREFKDLQLGLMLNSGFLTGSCKENIFYITSNIVLSWFRYVKNFWRGLRLRDLSGWLVVAATKKNDCCCKGYAIKLNARIWKTGTTPSWQCIRSRNSSCKDFKRVYLCEGEYFEGWIRNFILIELIKEPTEFIESSRGFSFIHIYLDVLLL